MKITGASLKIIRIKLEITQEDLSQYLGCSRGHLNMMERYRRSVPIQVQERMIWLEKQVETLNKVFEKTEKKPILVNRGSAQFVEDTLEQKQFDLETAEMELELLLRENVEYVRTMYLFQNMEPMPGLKKVAWDVFDAWHRFHAHRQSLLLEKSGPEVILRQRMKIAALKAELACLNEHRAISKPFKTEKPKKFTSRIKKKL